MSKKPVNIIIVETSQIVYEGLYSVLTTTGQPFNIQLTDGISELQLLSLKVKADFIFINPVLIHNQLKDFNSLKTELENTKWIGLVYSFFDQQILSAFDGIININDTPNKIIALLKGMLIADQQNGKPGRPQKILSDREVEVLKLLVEGNANKEIADKLNISTNTVISHRKNVSQKTGINSVSGLTIYAVVNKIISIDSYQE